MRIAIIGFGWVGKAMYEIFPHAYIYHPDRNSSNEVGQSRIMANSCDISFICVPTPVIGEGKLDTSIVEECIKWLKTPLIVVRSTVNPGDCARWEKKYKKRILFQPEYLGETPSHPLLDTKQTNFIIIGGSKREDRRKLIDLYATVYNANIKIRQLPLLEAEIVKLSENRSISIKVAEAQELYDVCELANVDYYQIREAVYGDDPRMNYWWTLIYPEKRGFNSKCIPKDVYAWCAWAESLGYKPQITRAILKKNKEWIKQA